jgi:hypothetical protein
MDSESDDHEGQKRPQTVRPFPQRLFSGGSVNRNHIQEISASSNEPVIADAGAQSPSKLELVRDGTPSNDPRGVYMATLTQSPVSSPGLSDEQTLFSPSSTSRSTLTRSRPAKKSSLLSDISFSPSDLAAADEFTSKRRWDDLRRHFLPSHLSPRATNVQRSTTPPPASNVPPRSSTPKQSRMAKLGPKQIVEQAQEAAVDQAKKFADDILRASRAVSSNDLKASRRERDGTLASMATSLNMSFMSSNANLGLASTSVPTHVPQSRSKAMWGPPSLQSMATVSRSPSAAFASLCTVISYYASIIPDQPYLARFFPYESEVLSSLLVPFVIHRSETAESERSQAVETFEVIVKTWPALDEVRPLVSIRQVILSYIFCLCHRPSLGAAFGVVKLRG